MKIIKLTSFPKLFSIILTKESDYCDSDDSDFKEEICNENKTIRKVWYQEVDNSEMNTVELMRVIAPSSYPEF